MNNREVLIKVFGLGAVEEATVTALRVINIDKLTFEDIGLLSDEVKKYIRYNRFSGKFEMTYLGEILAG